MLIAEKYNLRTIAQAIYASGYNVAERREDWLHLMMSLSGAGEAYLDTFLLLASQGSTYKEKESRREFLKAVRKHSDQDLAGFLAIAKKAGIDIRDHYSQDYRRQLEDNMRRLRSSDAPRKPMLSSLRQTTPNSSLLTPHSMTFLPSEYLTKCRSNHSTFAQSLVGSDILTPDQAHAAADLYHLGAMKDGSVIFWQIDTDGRLRDGKLMKYAADCHRIKDQGAQWLGYLMRTSLRGADGKPLLPMTWQATQCLFGLHLLPTDATAEVCIVEAEKTAVILSQIVPHCLWLAAGGQSQLSLEKLAPLAGRSITLYPDTDTDGSTYASWLRIVHEARARLNLNIKISDLLETSATPDQKLRKIDIADWLLEQRQEQPEPPQPAPSAVQPQPSPELQEMLNDNPDLQLLIDEFGLCELGVRS